ncbi:endo-1,4-beta-xylanase [Novosphingobium fuchskuhlense]|nr:endo-1,4-beta-xylanase [Novosphingobium fuchskuhlense]
MFRCLFAAVLLLPAPALAAETLVPLANPGFEGAYTALPAGGTVSGETAEGWDHNSGYGDTTTVYSRETSNPHSGSACQAIAVGAVRDGNLQLLQGVALKAGTVVTLTAWLRGAPGTFANVSLQGGPPGYAEIAGTAAAVGPGWQRVLAQGYATADENASIVISLNAPGRICIDDVRITTRPGKPAPVAGFGPVQPGFFGIHVSNFQFNRLRNPGFAAPTRSAGAEGAAISGEIAHDWDDNSEWADVAVRYAPDSTPVPGGGGAQAVTISRVTAGRQQMLQSVRVVPGRSYTFTALLRGTPGLAVDMLIRNADDPYNAHALATINDLGSTWKRYTVSGKVGPSGRIDLMFAADRPGTYSVADVTFTTADGKAVPAGVRVSPPGFGLLRLWDSGTTWAVLEPKPGAWQWDQLDRWLAARAPGQAVMLTLGQSPTWASSDPGWVNYNGAGAAAPPRNIADWTNYVTKVATRYKGRIQYYEIWNEPNDKTFYAGNVAQLAELTRTASAVIRRIDPAAKIVTAPPYSPGYLDQYLATGAAELADVIGYHVYATPPEEAARQLANVRLVLARRTTKPLWDTEGGSGDGTTPPDKARTYMARKYLVDMAVGASHFGWYGWGPDTPYAVGTVAPDDPRVETPAAKAFFTVRGWLVGAALVGTRIDAAGTWRMAFDLPGGKRALVLWNPGGAARFALPQPYRGGTVTDLDGATSPLPGAALDLTEAPVLVTAP